MSAYPTQSNIQTTGASVVPIGANGAGRSKLMSAAELRSAAAAYSSAQVDTLLAAKAPIASPTFTGTVAGITAAMVGAPSGSGTCSGTNTGDQDLSSYLTSSGAAGLYLPLAGGTLTGPITGTSGLVEQRSGLTAQCFKLSKAYTSGTNSESMLLDAGKQIASKLGVYSFKGSSGGSNIPIQIGMLATDGTTFTGVAVGTDGSVLFPSGSAAAPSVAVGGSTHGLYLAGASSLGISVAGAIRQTCWNDGSFYLSGSDPWLKIGTTTAPLIRRAASETIGVYQSNGSTPAIFISGQQIHVPPTSTITLATNGQFSIEMTSNTAGNLVYRGSDGTTRRMALTFS